MVFYKAPEIIALLSAALIIHVLSVLFDEKIKIRVIKIAYINFPIHILLLISLLNRGASLTELAALFMLSILVYLLAFRIRNIFLSHKKDEREEDTDDI